MTKSNEDEAAKEYFENTLKTQEDLNLQLRELFQQIPKIIDLHNSKRQEINKKAKEKVKELRENRDTDFNSTKKRDNNKSVIRHKSSANEDINEAKRSPKDVSAHPKNPGNNEKNNNADKYDKNETQPILKKTSSSNLADSQKNKRSKVPPPPIVDEPLEKPNKYYLRERSSSQIITGMKIAPS